MFLCKTQPHTCIFLYITQPLIYIVNWPRPQALISQEKEKDGAAKYAGVGKEPGTH